MDHARFEDPITILIGIGFPATIKNVMDAYALLEDWPVLNRNGAHTVALNACKACLAGEIEPETVRAALIAFARRNDILIPDTRSFAAPASGGRAQVTDTMAV